MIILISKVHIQDHVIKTISSIFKGIQDPETQRNFSDTTPILALKAYYRGTDWINKTIKNKRIRQGSVISLYSEIHKDDNDLIPFILEIKHDPRA